MKKNIVISMALLALSHTAMAMQPQPAVAFNVKSTATKPHAMVAMDLDATAESGVVNTQAAGGIAA